MEGDFTGRTSNSEFKTFTRGERAEIVRHEDQLKIEGKILLHFAKLLSL